MPVTSIRLHCSFQNHFSVKHCGMDCDISSSCTLWCRSLSCCRWPVLLTTAGAVRNMKWIILCAPEGFSEEGLTRHWLGITKANSYELAIGWINNELFTLLLNNFDTFLQLFEYFYSPSSSVCLTISSLSLLPSGLAKTSRSLTVTKGLSPLRV